MFQALPPVGAPSRGCRPPLVRCGGAGPVFGRLCSLGFFFLFLGVLTKAGGAQVLGTCCRASAAALAPPTGLPPCPTASTEMMDGLSSRSAAARTTSLRERARRARQRAPGDGNPEDIPPVSERV